MAHARIGRIKLKEGGELHVLHQVTPDNDGKENWRGLIVEHARTIAESGNDKQRLSGFLIIGLFSDGSTNAAFRYDPDANIMPRVLLPMFAEEVVRREVIMSSEAEYVFKEMYERI